MATDLHATPRSRPDVTMKISLAGDSAVGKTSLTRRFVTDTFDDTYVVTLGTRVSSRQFTMDDPRQPGIPLTVGASVWDIMGSHQFRELLKDAFFVNASAVVLVFDVNRPETLYDLPQWYEIVASVAGAIPTVVLANKSDLRGPKTLSVDSIAAFCKELRWPWLETSAKTGANVDAAFRRVAAEYLLGLREAAQPSGSA